MTQSSVHKSVSQWKHQRLSSAALIPLSAWFIIEILRHTQADYLTVLGWAAQPWIGATLALFTGLVFYHGALGLQVVIEDYIRHPFWQMALVFKVKAFCLVMAVMSWFFIIHIAIIGHK